MGKRRGKWGCFDKGKIKGGGEVHTSSGKGGKKEENKTLEK